MRDCRGALLDGVTGSAIRQGDDDRGGSLLSDPSDRARTRKFSR